MGRAAVGAEPAAAADAAGGRGAGGDREGVQGPAAAERVGDLDPARHPRDAADAHVAGAVDHEAVVVGERRGEHVGAQALGQSAAVERDARRPAHAAAGAGGITPAAVGRGRAGARRAPAERERERQRRTEVAPVARVRDLPRQRPVDQPTRVLAAARIASTSAPRSGLTGTSGRGSAFSRDSSLAGEKRVKRSCQPSSRVRASATDCASERSPASPATSTRQRPPKQANDRLIAAPPGRGGARGRPPCGRPPSRTTSSASIGGATAATVARNHAAPASVPSPSAWITPSSQARAVKRCNRFQRAGPMRPRM